MPFACGSQPLKGTIALSIDWHADMHPIHAVKSVNLDAHYYWQEREIMEGNPSQTDHNLMLTPKINDVCYMQALALYPLVAT
jgi:hypothetical protein